jgi:hypothetical protein
METKDQAIHSKGLARIATSRQALQLSTQSGFRPLRLDIQ